MASLSVRKIDEKIYVLLRKRATQHGVSMEEEVRQIISHAVETPESIPNVFNKYFGVKNGVNLNIDDHRQPHDPMDFKK